MVSWYFWLYWSLEGPLGGFEYRICWKPTHTNHHLHPDSDHHPRQKCALMKALLGQALCIYGPQYLGEELEHLNTVLQLNSYSSGEMRRAMHVCRPSWIDPSKEHQVVGTAFLSYIKSVTDHIWKLLELCRVHTVSFLFVCVFFFQYRRSKILVQDTNCKKRWNFCQFTNTY